MAERRKGARDSLKAVIRWTGTATAALRPPPDFLIIGAKRGGTTSFYFDLIEHPAIIRLFPPPIPGLKPDATKGVHYFDSNFDRGEDWYRGYMPTTATRRITQHRNGGNALAGEASPYYLFHPAAAHRAHAAAPEAKIIVLLRDPVQRTYSHWKERRRSGAEELGFPEALAVEDERLAGERERLLEDPSYYSYAWEQQSYATQSRYAECLRPWIGLYGPGNVLALASEEYYSDPLGTLGDVDEFLGLHRRQHTSGTIRNAAPGQPVPDDARAVLAKTFRDPNDALFDMLDRSLPWSRQ